MSEPAKPQTIEAADRFQYLYLTEKARADELQRILSGAALQALGAQLVSKYQLGPEDSIDFDSGVISRAPAPALAEVVPLAPQPPAAEETKKEG